MEIFIMLIENHIKACVGADRLDTSYFQGLTELEYHIAKIVDRLLIATGHGRLEIGVQLKGGKHEKV
jgi:hypothetical protein